MDAVLLNPNSNHDGFCGGQEVKRSKVVSNRFHPSFQMFAKWMPLLQEVQDVNGSVANSAKSYVSPKRP